MVNNEIDDLRSFAVQTPLREKLLTSGVAIAFAMAAAIYFIYFSAVLSSKPGGPEAWGQFGDFIGGVVNPVIGVATVLLIATTLRETRNEARLTRYEMQSQHKAMEQQLAHFQREAYLADLRARLEGILEAWNFSMDIPALIFVRGSRVAEDNESHADVSERTYRAHLYDPRLISEMTRVMRGPHGEDTRRFWNRELEVFLQMLRELASYCTQYDSEVGSKMLTDFYRNRIQSPLRVFNVVGIIDREVLEQLLVSQNFLEIV